MSDFEALWADAWQRLGCDGIYTVVRESGAFRLLPRRGGISGALDSARLHWKMESLLAEYLGPERDIQKLEARELRVRSLVLGFCQQLLMMRLPPHKPEELARWLVNPARAPLRVRATVRRLIAVQARRNVLSPVWKGIAVPEAEGSRIEAPTPAADSEPVWRGIPVCAGVMEGLVMSPDAAEPGTILVARYAKPEAVEFFDRAVAVVFSEGGVLSHACSIARERNLPCVTGVGASFFSEVERRRPCRVRVEVNEDGSQAWVRIL